MGVFYTLNVFIMQFYLGVWGRRWPCACISSMHLVYCTRVSVPPVAAAGTTRLQLQRKGDSGEYTDFANIVVAFAFLTIPVIGWLLDKKVNTPGQRSGGLAAMTSPPS